MRIIGYLKKPQHLRWELYPVAHEDPEKVEYGGSYLENTEWWKDKYRSCMVGALKGFLIEALFLKAVWEHNRTLWVRTYPFHIGLYLLIGAMGMTILSALGMLAGADGFVTFCTVITVICDVFGFAGILFGSIGLIQRRLCARVCASTPPTNTSSTSVCSACTACSASCCASVTACTTSPSWATASSMACSPSLPWN